MNAKKDKPKGNVIYLGSTIPRKIKSGTVFKEGEYPPIVEKMIEDYPLMQQLFIPVSDIVAATVELNKKESYLKTVKDKTYERFMER